MWNTMKTKIVYNGLAIKYIIIESNIYVVTWDYNLTE